MFKSKRRDSITESLLFFFANNTLGIMRQKKGAHDEMKTMIINTRIVKWLISKLISKVVKNRYGYKIEVKIDDFDLDMGGDITTIKMNAEVKMNQNEFEQMLKDLL